MIGHLLAGIIVCLAVGTPTAQERIPVTGDRLSGFVLPVEPVPGDARISALRAWGWTVDDTKRLLLQEQVVIEIGDERFVADEAVVWINRIASAQGQISQVALYFPLLENPTERGGFSIAGRDVLVTGSTRGAVALDTALLNDRRPAETGVTRAARARLAEYLRRLLEAPPALATRPQVYNERPPSTLIPRPGDPVRPPEPPAAARAAVDAALEGAGPPIFAPSGTVWFSWDDLSLTSGEQENVITATGGVVAQYLAGGRGEWSQLTLKAQRAVVFTDPGPLDELLTGRLDAGSIRGIYLEGNVVITADGDRYVLRAPRAYYDFQRNRAIMLETVLRTYNRRFRVPFYARAREMRQLAANQWSADRARVSASEFATPHFAIGSRRVVVTQQPGDEGGDSELFLEADHNVLDFDGIPIMYWPHFEGTLEEVPLKGLEVGYRSSEGVRILTRWNPLALLGIEAPHGVEAEVSADGFTKRGAGAGLDLAYDLAGAVGGVDLYYLFDEGTDRTSSGRDVEPAKKNRGYGTWTHLQPLGGGWDLKGQFSWISDETFITTWREASFQERREYETSAYVVHQKGTAAFDALLKYNLNSFISNSYLLASRAYQVQKVPEITYRRIGDDLFGALTYTGDTRLGRVKFNFESGTPNSLGVRPGAFSDLGIGPNDDITAAFLAAGFPAEWVSRFDTRHELALPLAMGPIKAVPFATGRVTVYGDDYFNDFSSESSDVRWFGAVGLRMSTEFQRVYNGVESRLLDMHRLRHVLRPRLLAWYGTTTVPKGALPVYDQDVEAIGGTSAVEVGLSSILQTQRGGAGRWRSVDYLTVDASVVLNSDDANRIPTQTPQFFDYRPEYSLWGDHVFASATWLISDFLSVVGETTYDLDESVFARASIGTELRHSPVLVTYIEYRYLEASDNELLQVGWQYQLSPKYEIVFLPQWDFVANDFRAINLTVRRQFPDFSFAVIVRRDLISDETTLGASLDLVEF